MLPGWVLYPDHATRVVYAPPARLYPGGMYFLLGYTRVGVTPSWHATLVGVTPPGMLPWWVLYTLRTLVGIVHPEDHGGYTPPYYAARGTMVGIHLPTMLGPPTLLGIPCTLTVRPAVCTSPT